MVELANVIVRKGKAYVPVMGQIPEGLHVIMEPVYAADLKQEAIASALERVVAAGHPLVRTPTRRETEQRAEGKDPVLRAAGVRSWSELAKGGQSYAILWEGDHIKLLPSKHDPHGRFVDDPTRAEVFPKDTPLLKIAEAIMEDVRSRPELEEGGRNVR